MLTNSYSKKNTGGKNHYKGKLFMAIEFVSANFSIVNIMYE